MAQMTITPVATHGFLVDGRWIEDGNLVEYDWPGALVWSAYAPYAPNSSLAMQGDGNLVIFSV